MLAARSSTVGTEIVVERLVAQLSTMEHLLAKDEKGRTALMYSVTYGWIEVMTLILALCPPEVLLARSDKGFTALMYAAMSSGTWAPAATAALVAHLPTTEHLLAGDEDGQTALIHAVKHCRIEVVTSILTHCPPEVLLARSVTGFTALMYAAVSTAPAVTAALVAHLPTREHLMQRLRKGGQTALILAAAYGCVGNVDALLSAEPGDQLFAKGARGHTALICACMRNRLDIVRSLLAHGSEQLGATDEKGKTAICIALLKGHKDVLRELLSHIGDSQIACIAAMKGCGDLVRELVSHVGDNGVDLARLATLMFAMQGPSSGAVVNRDDNGDNKEFEFVLHAVEAAVTAEAMDEGVEEAAAEGVEEAAAESIEAKRQRLQ